jgi:hypothetical protein
MTKNTEVNQVINAGIAIGVIFLITQLLNNFVLMNKNFQHLQHIINVFRVDVDHFYSINFSKFEISLQGKMTSSTIAHYKEFFSFELVGTYLEASARLDGVHVRIILT